MENARYMVHLPNETIEETKAFLEQKEAEGIYLRSGKALAGFLQKGIEHTQI